MMRKLTIQQEPVFCLHIRKYRETSAILECLSRNYGRFSLIAKGAYRSRSPKAIPAYFQAYVLSGILRTELGILTDLEMSISWPKLHGQRWFVANYLNELLLKLLPQLEPVPELYIEYTKTLSVLTSEEDYAYQLLIFEKRLLDILGYGINLTTSVPNEDLLERNAFYSFNPTSGFRLSAKSKHGAINGEVIVALGKEDESFFNKHASYLQQAKRVVRMALKMQLGSSELKTVTVLRDANTFSTVR